MRKKKDSNQDIKNQKVTNELQIFFQKKSLEILEHYLLMTNHILLQVI